MRTHKKCKGTGKAKDFNSCGDNVLAQTRKYGLCRDCFKEWALSTDEGNKYIEKVAIKAKKQVEKEQKQKRKKELEKFIDYKLKIQTVVNEISRLIDIGLPCLALGYHANQIHGGHIFSRGAESNMRWNLHNIHRQSAKSNHSGNDDGLLREKLQLEYGVEYYEFLKWCRQTPQIKFTQPELKELYRRACKIRNRYKRAGKRFSRDERISERNKVNLELGIYPRKFCLFEII